MTPDLLKDEILSPEGVEEKLIQRDAFSITLTGGGKYRTYIENRDGKRNEGGRSYETLNDRKHGR